jgi:hypothetical protein
MRKIEIEDLKNELKDKKKEKKMVGGLKKALQIKLIQP